MRAGVERFTGRLYRTAIEWTPSLQNLWYLAVARCSWVRRFYRDVVGARIGRGMAEQLRDARPDVIVSTYPLATAALSWLKAHGRLNVPVVAVLSDFAPHAFWVYPHVDRYVLLSERGRERMRSLAPGVPVQVSAPLVTADFRPPTESEREAARQRHHIPAPALAVLVSAGALGLGSVRSAVRAIHAAGPPAYAIVVCGRNASLAAALRREFESSDRVVVLDWVEDMAGLMAGVDVVVNNAGGLTAEEALATARALILYQPIAGHGRDCAAELAAAGLAEVGTRQRWLTALLREWAVRPEQLAAAQRRAIEHAGAHQLAETAGLIVGTARSDAAEARRRVAMGGRPGAVTR
jgi:UDP-N-acetylglucosamine:LPS N-acetylglucosamine transferase